jgi:hypothetical protein
MLSDLVNELLILQKWRDSASPIKFKISSRALSSQGWATVVRADSSEVALDFSNGAGFMTFDPSLCEFRYQDSREADDAIHSDVDAKVVCALSIWLPGEIDLFLFEWKSEDAKS